MERAGAKLLLVLFVLGTGIVLIPFSAAAQASANVRRLYPGPALPANDVAIFKSPWRIQTLNGGRVPGDRDLELIPGPHVLSLTQSLSGKQGERYLRFEAKPGHTYELRIAGDKPSVIDTSSSEDVNQPFQWVDAGGLFLTGLDGQLHLISGDKYWPAMNSEWVTAIRVEGKKKLKFILPVSTPEFLKDQFGMEPSTNLWLWGVPRAPLVNAGGKLMPNQVVTLTAEQGKQGELFILEGNDILLLGEDLMVIDDNGLAIRILDLDVGEIEKLTGSARDIAMALTKEQVTRIDLKKSWIAFTQARNGVLAGEFLCRNKAKREITIAVPPREAPPQR